MNVVYFSGKGEGESFHAYYTMSHCSQIEVFSGKNC